MAPRILNHLSYLTDNKSRLAVRLGIVLYLLVSLAYLALGEANADEGWYLYASRLVMQGALPYRDFAYTQMPLLPYVYGPLQILHESVLFGRLTSVLLSIGTLVMCMVVARRYAGTRASAITVMLFSALTFCVYYVSIVKTYALVAFCFAATLFFLTSERGDDSKYPTALAFALIAALVRVTAIFFTAPVLVYLLLVGSHRTRAWAFLETAAAGLIAFFFLSADWASALWNLATSHLSHWGSSPLFDRLKDIFTVRLPEVTQTFGPELVLALAAFFFLFRFRGAWSWRTDLAPLFAFAAAIVVFAGSNLANGVWANEYLVPAALCLVPIIAVALSRLLLEMPASTRSFAYGALVAAVVLLPMTESTQHTDLTGGRLPLVEVNRAADFVAENSRPGDKVLALEALNVVVEANRSALPGMSLAQFSLQNVDRVTAQRLHVVNEDMIVQAIDLKEARALVLTDADLDSLTLAANSQALPLGLEHNYYDAFVMTQFGEYSRTLHVFLSK